MRKLYFSLFIFLIFFLNTFPTSDVHKELSEPEYRQYLAALVVLWATPSASVDKECDNFIKKHKLSKKIKKYLIDTIQQSRKDEKDAEKYSPVGEAGELIEKGLTNQAIVLLKSFISHNPYDKLPENIKIEYDEMMSYLDPYYRGDTARGYTQAESQEQITLGDELRALLKSGDRTGAEAKLAILKTKYPVSPLTLYLENILKNGLPPPPPSDEE